MLSSTKILLEFCVMKSKREPSAATFGCLARNRLKRWTTSLTWVRRGLKIGKEVIR